MGGQGAKEQAKAPSGAKESPKEQETKEDSWVNKYLVPPLWKQDGHPEKEWAKEELKNKLEEWAAPFIEFPDKVVTPIQIWGRHRKKDKE